MYAVPPFTHIEMTTAIADGRSLPGEGSSVRERDGGASTGRSVAKKCLFGPSDPADVERMLEEEYRVERRRFMDRFGVDIDVVERKFGNKKEIKRLLIKTGHSGNSKRKTVDGGPSRGVLKAYNKQLKVTDCFKAKKPASSSSSSSIKDKGQ